MTAPKNTKEFTDEQIVNAHKIVQHAQKTGYLIPRHHDEVYVGWVLFKNITNQVEFTFAFNPEWWDIDFFGVYENLDELEDDLEDAIRNIDEMSIWNDYVYFI